MILGVTMGQRGYIFIFRILNQIQHSDLLLECLLWNNFSLSQIKTRSILGSVHLMQYELEGELIKILEGTGRELRKRVRGG